MTVEEHIRHVAQEIKNGLLDSQNVESAVDYIVEGLSKASTNETIEVVNDKGKVLINPTDTEMYQFLNAIDFKKIDSTLKGKSGVKLAKGFAQELLKLAKAKSSSSSVTDNLELFLKGLE